MTDPADKPATWDELKPGIRVKCIYHITNRFGKTATIVWVDQANVVHTIKVEWDDGDTVYLNWSNASSFTIIQDASVVAQDTATPEAATQQVSVAPVATTEPAFDFNAYNGIRRY